MPSSGVRGRRSLHLRVSLTLASLVLGAAVLQVTLGLEYGWHQATMRIEAQAKAAAAAIAQGGRDDPAAIQALSALGADPAVAAVDVLSQKDKSHAAPLQPGAFPVTEAVRELRIDAPDSAPQFLRVRLRTADILAPVAYRSAGFFLVLAAGGLLAWIVMVRILRTRLHRPIEETAQGIRRILEAHDLRARLEIGNGGELDGLQEQINALINECQSADRNLRAFKKEFERRLRERTQELEALLTKTQTSVRLAEEASRAKGDFLARMSHEIRTPLNGVLGMADLLQHSTTLEDRQRRYAVVIHESGRALLQLINDVLDFSKIEAGKLELEKSRFCVREMIEDSLEIMAERAQSKGLELLCDIPYDLDTAVYGDSLRLRQVILNLVGNAVKFTDRGEIVVRVRSQPSIENTNFTFEVCDTGIGIEAADREAIFESFVQARGSGNRRATGGTGLGLAICKQLVELMGGTIGVESSPGAGSRFHFCVPLAVDRTAHRERSTSEFATLRFLLIEASEPARRMLREHLTSWGSIVTEVDSLAAAKVRLRRAFEGEFDALILDAHLSQAGIAEAIEALRGSDAFADIPVLVTHTGVNEPKTTSVVRAPIAWQSKPLRRSGLKSALKGLLANARGAPLLNGPTPEVPTAPAGEGPPPSTVRGQRVLLVEDNPVNHEVACAMLQTLGVESDWANSGHRALEMLAERAYDAVLMDCEMPELDGYATTQRLRDWESLEGRPAARVIALTANALKGDAERCRAAGMDDYLSKPFTIEELRAVLDRATSRPPQAPALQGTAIIDEAALAQVLKMQAAGSPNLLGRLIQAYVGSSREILRDLNRALDAPDLEGARRAAHVLKSSSANVGASRVASLSRRLEQAAGDGDLRESVRLAPEIGREHGDAVEALLRYCAPPAQSRAEAVQTPIHRAGDP
ncbi:MAG: response regulator [Proteobacteria bacterium]|nr:response regulator [Pseudomonadota bacterium]